MLYIKSLFIFGNDLPKEENQKRAALELLLADWDILFKDGDSTIGIAT